MPQRLVHAHWANLLLLAVGARRPTMLMPLLILVLVRVDGTIVVVVVAPVAAAAADVAADVAMHGRETHTCKPPARALSCIDYKLDSQSHT